MPVWADLQHLAQYILRNPFVVNKMAIESPGDTIIYGAGSPAEFPAAITQHIPLGISWYWTCFSGLRRLLYAGLVDQLGVQSRPNETNENNQDATSSVWKRSAVQLRVLQACARAGDNLDGLPRLMRPLFQLVLVACLLNFNLLPAAPPPGKPVTLSGPDALDKAIQTLAGDMTNQLQAADQRAQKVTSSSHDLSVSMWAIVALVVGVIVVSRHLPVFANFFAKRDSSWAPVSSDKPSAGHQEAFSKFVEDFGSRRNPPAFGDSSESAPSRGKPLPGRPTDHRSPEIRRGTQDQVTRVRKLFSRLSRASNPDSRKQDMTELLEAVRILRDALEAPTAHSARQLASALEALLDEVATKHERATASVLRTVAGAIDLLPALCGPGVRPDLSSSPVVRLLGVDDDAISRYTLTCALRQHFPRPDLAVNGDDALPLAESRPYDLIFVDIEMPGMDGFELCSRIHSTASNQATPIVFVTGHDDLGSRAKSLVSGGAEFLGKPFLTFELTVKALTLVLKRRLQGTQPPTKPARTPVKEPATAA